MSRSLVICALFAFHGAALMASIQSQPAAANSSTSRAGAIEGMVTREDGEPAHHAAVMIVESGETVEAGHDGKFRFDGVRPGNYELFAYVSSLSSQVKSVTVVADSTATVDLRLLLSPLRETVTVTARGRHETKFEAVQSVNSLDSFDLAEKLATSVGEVLEGELGVAKRSFGPGSARPVIRGFDGDRVLVMNDGLPAGSVGSQSGDHAEPVDPANLERLEVVKGPATLLYGSSALGGVVNAISRHHEMHQHRHEGIRGQLSSSAGSNNGLAGLGGTVEYGLGPWVFWAGGGNTRTGDYSSPAGLVENSKSRISSASGGLGWFGEKPYFSLGYVLRDGNYGVPFASEFHSHQHEDEEEEHADEEDHEAEEEHEEVDIDLDWRHHSLKATGGLDNLDGYFRKLGLSLHYAAWDHQELEVEPGGVSTVGTQFADDTLTFRTELEQHQAGPSSGVLGFSASWRDYEATGEEALSPPVEQAGASLFTLQELNFDRLKLQLGGRLEHIRYRPLGPAVGHHHEDEGEDHEEEEGELLPERSFTGISAAAGGRLRLWDGGAFVANLSTSFRAPALEELYNFGPHVGNLAFEVGNPNLVRERALGVDFSLRHSADRVRGELNIFHYHIDDFIFGAPTGTYQHGLLELDYSQGDARFVGVEAALDLGLAPSLWLNLALDSVDAELTASGTALPRIPPLRSRSGLDLRLGGFSVRPELVLAAAQEEVFETESRTPGYAVVNLKSSYTLPQRHFVHLFYLEVFNVGDRLYRNHVSFIKDLAPEIGRGVRFSYAVQFF